MAFSLFKHREKYNNTNKKDFILDNDADFDSLPGIEQCAPGSTGYSIATGTTKILNHAGQWVTKKDTGGGGGGGCAFGMTDVSEEGM